MTPLFPAQRAAEEFDKVLEGRATEAVADRYAELLDAVQILRAQPELLPRAEFVGDLRSRLMTAAETELVAAPPVRHPPPTRSTKRNRRIGTVAASLVIVGGSAGMAVAASGALPGEPLYPIKRGVEEVGTAVRLNDVSKGEALLDQADTRLGEVRELQAAGSPDPELVASTIESFQRAADEGSAKLFTAYQADGNVADIETVRTFTAQQMADIVAMSAVGGNGIDGFLLDAADTVADIDQQAMVLCGTCGPKAALLPPEALSAAAGAATVDNLLARPVSQATVDIDAAEAARIATLKALAEKKAGEIPKVDDLTSGGGSDGLPSTSDEDQVKSTLTPDGHLVPSITTGAAVKDLVTGVTVTVDEVTSNVVKPKTPLGDTVDDLTDTVDDLTGELLPGVPEN